jgi:hypothetical protein
MEFIYQIFCMTIFVYSLYELKHQIKIDKEMHTKQTKNCDKWRAIVQQVILENRTKSCNDLATDATEVLCLSLTNYPHASLSSIYTHSYMYPIMIPFLLLIREIQL